MLLQPSVGFNIARHGIVHQLPESLGMIHFYAVCQFVDNHRTETHARCTKETRREVDVPFAGA